jgi:hypothetical protein
MVGRKGFQILDFKFQKGTPQYNPDSSLEKAVFSLLLLVFVVMFGIFVNSKL